MHMNRVYFHSLVIKTLDLPQSDQEVTKHEANKLKTLKNCREITAAGNPGITNYNGFNKTSILPRSIPLDPSKDKIDEEKSQELNIPKRVVKQPN